MNSVIVQIQWQLQITVAGHPVTCPVFNSSCFSSEFDPSFDTVCINETFGAAQLFVGWLNTSFHYLVMFNINIETLFVSFSPFATIN